MRNLMTFGVAAFAFAATVFAQSQQPPAPGAGRGPQMQRVVSPEVHPDRRITFRLNAPKASEVLLQFSESATEPRPMTKGENGIWSLTIGPVDPEIYSYSFLVDGLKMLDLSNGQIKLGQALDASVVEVPGTPARFDELQRVPHGSVNIHTYMSTPQGRQRGIYIYVPAEYYTQPNRRYPVLYLFHGGGGVETDWYRDGRAGVIMDNLIAEKKALPMIVVMPNNNFAAPGPAGAGRGPVGANYEVAEKEIVGDIIPLVEKNYRTLPGRENRAIAGLSAGGGTSINVGLKRLDTFATVAEFSSGLFGGLATYAPFDIEKLSPGFYKDPAATNKRMRLFYMSCGTEDPRMPYQKKVLEEFTSHKIAVTFKPFPGVHEWKVWRHSLADLAPLLFR